MVAAGKIRGKGSSRPYLVFSFGMVICDASLKLVSLVGVEVFVFHWDCTVRDSLTALVVI